MHDGWIDRMTLLRLENLADSGYVADVHRRRALYLGDVLPVVGVVRSLGDRDVVFRRVGVSKALSKTLRKSDLPFGGGRMGVHCMCPRSKRG